MTLKMIIKRYYFPLLDFILSPVILTAAILLKFSRRLALNNGKISKVIFNTVGVFPIIDHYIDPLFQKKNLKRPLSTERQLSGINWDIEGQIDLLHHFNYEKELERLPMDKPKELGFYYNNGSFNPGDAEILYSIIRFFKPKRIVEIGSGNSTLMAREAIKINCNESKEYQCRHTCIEPFHMPWLENINVHVERKLVENISFTLFKELEENDILFIDSSHIIRPQGDVTHIYLEILPILKPGVIIHIHDIFTPADIHEGFLLKEMFLWNEQYILEAFLTCNPYFKVVSALSYLKRHYPDLMREKCPILRRQFDIGEPRSFWIKRTA